MPNKKLTRPLLLLSAVILALFFFRLGARTFWDPDEGRYAEIPREMIESGDYLTPRLNYTLYYEKPPLFYWLTAASFRFLGEKEWAARLIPATAGAAGVLLTFFFLLQLGKKEEAWTAAFVQSTTLSYVLLSRMLVIDMLFSLFLNAALTFFYLGALLEQHRKRAFIFSWIALALSILTKGPVAFVLVAVILCITALKKSFRQSIFAYFLCWQGILFFLIIVKPWFVAMSLTHRGYAYFFFIREHILRFATPVAHHQQPAYFFLEIAPLYFFPWSLFLLVALLANRHKIGKALKRSPLFFFLMIWIGTIFLFFSVSQSKLVTYILPLVMPISILTAFGFRERLWISKRGSQALLILYALLTTLMITALAVLSTNHRYQIETGSLSRAVTLTLLLLAAGYIALIFFFREGSSTRAFQGIALFGFLFLFSLPPLGHALSPYYSTARLGKALRKQLKKDDFVVVVGKYPQSLGFYAQTRLALFGTTSELEVDYTGEKKKPYFLDKREDLLSIIRAKQRIFLVISMHEMESLASFLPKGYTARRMATGKKYALFLINSTEK